jgi:hypothetical protein
MELFRHTAYFQSIYTLKVTISGSSISTNQKHYNLTGMASFKGMRKADFFQQPEGRDLLLNSLKTCLESLQPEK